MSDRMSELMRLDASQPPMSPAEPNAAAAQGEAAAAAAPAAEVYTIDADAALAKFNTVVGSIREGTQTITSETDRIQQLHRKKLQTADLQEQSRLQQEIITASEGINASSIKTKDLLRGIQNDVAALKQTPDSIAANIGIIKIQENQYNYLLRSFMSAMDRYQAMQEESKREVIEEATRRIKINYTNKDGSSIDEATAAQLATEVIELGTENAIFQQSKDTLQRIIEDRNDILRIERSMRELNQLFNDLAVLVNEQGEVLDQVLTNVQQSVAFVEKGRKQLAAAKVHAKRSRKCICVIILGVLVIALFIIVPIIALTIPIPGK